MRTLRIVLFFLLVPGTIIVYLPLLLGVEVFPARHIVGPLRILAAVCWIAGGAIARRSVLAFFTIGKGTPSPADPPKVLVTSGTYACTRNPIYLGGLLVLLGHALFLQSWSLVLYLLLSFLFFHLVIVFREEPLLRRQYGTAYDEYRSRVPRWLGRRTPEKGDGGGFPT